MSFQVSTNMMHFEGLFAVQVENDRTKIVMTAMTVMHRTWDLEHYLLSSSHLHQITLGKKKYKSLPSFVLPNCIMSLYCFQLYFSQCSAREIKITSDSFPSSRVCRQQGWDERSNVSRGPSLHAERGLTGSSARGDLALRWLCFCVPQASSRLRNSTKPGSCSAPT